MKDPARNSQWTNGSVWTFLTRKPALLAAAGLIGAAAVGANMLSESSFALAQSDSAKQTVTTPLGSAPLSFADLVQKVSPAVVSVQVKNGGKKTDREFSFRGMPDLPDDHPLNEFFKRFNRGEPRQNRPPQPTLAQGSGFIISSDGFVVTNHHVVDKASEIILTLDNGDKYDAEVVGGDQRTDLALLKIKTKSKKSFPVVEFAKTRARVGDWVLAVGNPFGLGGTVTAGIISAHNRDIGSGPYDYLQIDAAVNRGNSGGPAFNLEGKVVGVNTAIFSPSGGNVGIAFAVPAALAEKVIAQLQKNGSVARGWLGVTIQNVSDDIALSLGLKEPKGAMVTKLSQGGPASKSDLEVGDVIVRVDDDAIGDSRDLARTIAEYTPNTKIRVAVLRDGKEKVVPVTLGKFPSGKQLAALQSGKPSAPTGHEMEDLGLSLAPAVEQEGAGDEGVVIIDVDPSGKAAAKGLKAGDVILKVAGITVSEPKDVAEGVRKAKRRGRGAVDMLVRSGERQRFIAIPFKKT